MGVWKFLPTEELVEIIDEIRGGTYVRISNIKWHMDNFSVCNFIRDTHMMHRGKWPVWKPPSRFELSAGSTRRSFSYYQIAEALGIGKWE